MNDTRLIKSGLGLVSACLAIAVAGGAPAAAATNPTVISGTHAASISIPTGSLAEMASLPLPAGRWLVIAKGNVSGVADDLDTYSVTCRLTAGGDFDVGLLTPGDADGPNSRLPLVLTVVHHFTAPGEAVLGCSAHVAGTAVIGQISLQAIKAGTLTNGPIGAVGTTTGSGAPRVISAYRDAAVFTPKDDWSAPQDLPLSQGRWLIIAKASVSGPQSGNILPRIQCRVVGMSGSNVLFGDLVLGHLGPIGGPVSRMVMAVQTAGSFGPAGGFARFECSSQYNGHGFSWLKITAVRLGKLTTHNLTMGTISSQGSGTPRLIRATRDSAGTTSLSTTYKNFTSLPLPAGKWLVSGKLTITGDGTAPVRVDCRLVGSKTDVSRFTLTPGFSSGPFWFQVIHVASDPATVRVQCKRVGPAWTFHVFLVHVSAMRVGTLTQQWI